MIEEFRQQLGGLENSLSSKFSDLLKEKSLYELNDIKDFEELDDYFEVRNDITGDVFDVFVLYVSHGSIRAVDANDREEEYTFKFSDLSSVSDRINLIELMYLNTKK